MEKKGKRTYIPKKLVKEVDQIRKIHNTRNNAEAFNLLVDFSRLGREFKKKDLLGANLLYIKSKKKRR